jgi:hypothetical protein
VANCFATDQSSALVEASLGNCCCQHHLIRNQSNQCRHPIRVQIAAVSCVSCVSVAYPKQIQSEYVKRMDMNRLWYQAYRLSVAYPKRIQSEYVKGMETNRCGIKRIGCVSKANTSKGWKRINCGIKRIGCVSTVRNGSTRQTDRLPSNDDRRFSSLEACNGPVASTVLLATASGSSGGSTGFKGAQTTGNSRKLVVIVDSERVVVVDRTMTRFGQWKLLLLPLPPPTVPTQC